MGMIRAMRLLNAATSGNLSGAEIETLLTTGDQLGEFQQLLSLKGQVGLLASSSIALTNMLGSATARSAIFSSPVASAEIFSSELSANIVAASADAMSTLAASPIGLSEMAKSVGFSAIVADADAMDTLAAAPLAMDAIYNQPRAIQKIMPSAWGVYAPHADQFALAGDLVGTWKDASGNGRNFFAATNNRPTFISENSINGYSTVKFDNSLNNRMSLSSLFDSTEYTMFFVYRRLESAPSALIGDGNADSFVTSSTTSFVAYEGGSGSTFSGVSPAAVNTWGISRVRRTGPSEAFLSLNGGTESPAITINIPNFANVTLYLAWGNSTAYADMQYAEIILLKNTSAIDGEVTRVTNLLKTKYGL
jgi:hypothetical protein